VVTQHNPKSRGVRSSYNPSAKPTPKLSILHYSFFIALIACPQGKFHPTAGRISPSATALDFTEKGTPKGAFF